MKVPFLIGLSAILLCQCARQQAPVAVTAPAATSPVTPEPEKQQQTHETAPHLPAELCYVDEIIPGIVVDLKYCGTDNFVGRPIAGYTSGCRAILRQDTAECLAKAQQALAQKGLALKIWDAYRPHPAMEDFHAWSRTPDESKKAEFYPRITKQDIYDEKYISRRSAHSCGLAVDVTLIHLGTGEELDMGGRHDLLDESSATRYPGLTPEQQANRLLLLQVMTDAGLRNYRKEWWHYSLKTQEKATRYHFPLQDNLIHRP